MLTRFWLPPTDRLGTPTREGSRAIEAFSTVSHLLAPEPSAYDVRMNGQWLGRFAGATSGSIVVNIDERPEYYEGTANLIEDDETLPDSFVSFRTANKEPSFQFRTGVILAIDKNTGAGLSLEQLQQRLGANQAFSKYADVRGTVDQDSLTLSWTTDTGVQGNCVLPRSKAGKPSELVPLEKNWTEFREYVDFLPRQRRSAEDPPSGCPGRPSRKKKD